MQRNRWSRDFDWVKTGTTYYQQNRLEKYNEGRFIAVGDIYFKLNKYLTGVTFSYINSLNNIYKRDLLTGDGYSIVNMYNEYDVIDRAMKNIVFVDIASDTNIDTNLQWTKIDGVKLKPGHKVLLFKQTSEFKNDIYVVTPQYYLVNAGLLSTREKSDKFSCSIKLGTHKDEQYFLLNNGLDFPTTYEPKYFIEGKSYIVKNIIKYNIYNSSTNSAITSKIIFTDYDFARKQLIENYNLFNDFSMNLCGITTSDYFFNISYHHDEYKIRLGSTNVMLGPIGAIINTTYALGSIVPINYDGTLYDIDGGFSSTYSGLTLDFDVDGGGVTIPPYVGLSYSGVSFKVGDHLQIRFINTLETGTTVTQFLSMKTFIKEVQTPDTLTIDGGDSNSFYIDGGSAIITGVTMDAGDSSSGSTDIIDAGDAISLGDYDGGFSNNLSNIPTIDGGASLNNLSNFIILEDAIPNSIINDLNSYFFEITNLNVARTWTEAVNFLGQTKFIDFYDVETGSTVTYSGDTATSGNLTFSTKENKYDKYFDYHGLEFFRSDSLTSAYGFTTPIQYIKYRLYDRLSNINSIVFTSIMSIYNTYYLNVDRYEYTDNGRIRLLFNTSGLTNIFRPYTYVNATAEGTIKTLVYSVGDYEVVIEKPLAWSIYPTQAQLPVVTSIQNIDGLKNISDILYEVYMNVTYDWYIQKSDNERKYICGAYAQILTENEAFRENVTGVLFENDKNEFILKLYDIENDKQLKYSPIELSFIGADRKTRLPVPLTNNFTTTIGDNMNFDILIGGYNYSIEGDVFNLGLNVVLGGPNNLPLLSTILDGNA